MLVVNSFALSNANVSLVVLATTIHVIIMQTHEVVSFIFVARGNNYWRVQVYSAGWTYACMMI